MLRTSSRITHALLLGLILVLTACTGGASPPRPSATSTVAAASALTPTPYGGAGAQLGPLPASCPASPPPATIVMNRHFAQFAGPAVGFGPVWVGIGGYHHFPLAVLWDQRDAAQLHTSQGWSTKLAWLVSRAYHGEVTFSGHSLEDGLPLSPQARYALQTRSTPTELVVDPNDSGVTQAYPDPTWSLFVGGITIPHAGCYQLDAHWKGGMWRIIFAAGTVAFA